MQIEKLRDFIKSEFDRAKENNAKFIVIGHSWGTFLTYMSLIELSNIYSEFHVDLFILLSSPLGTEYANKYLTEIEYIIKKFYVDKYKNEFNFSSWENSINVGLLLNYWAHKDVISGPINEFNPQAIDISVDPYIGPIERFTLRSNPYVLPNTKKWHDYTALNYPTKIGDHLRLAIQREIENIILEQTEQPKPELVLYEDSPSEIQFGESFTMQMSANNFGGISTYGSITVSFPTLVDEMDVNVVKIRDGENVQTSAPELVEYYPKGDARLTNRENDPGFTSKYLTVELGDNYWTTYKEHALALEITPNKSGEFIIDIRANLGNIETGAFYNNPIESEVRDQQDWPVIRKVVYVGMEPHPEPISFNLPDEITVGETTEISIGIQNLGGSSNYGSLSFTFPGIDAETAGTIGYITNYTTDDFPGYMLFRPGDMIFHKNGNQIVANDLMVEYGDEVWESSEMNYAGVQITPQKAGELVVLIRSALGNTNIGAFNNWPEESLITDQQGWPVIEHTILVNEPGLDPYLNVRPMQVNIESGSGQFEIDIENLGGGLMDWQADITLGQTVDDPAYHQ
jgi:hypothetical protein